MSPRAAARLETLGRTDVYEYQAGKLDWMAAGLPTEGTNATRPRAGTVARTDVPTASLSERVGDVRDRVRAAGWEAAVVIDPQRVVLGFLGAKELEKDGELTVEVAMKPAPSTFRPYVPIKEVADFLVKHDFQSSPITTSDGKLVGLVLRSDAVREAEGCPDCVRSMI
ncbi:MAG TPA: CBS domain-containing protein [Candidatus Dormibacteraeota bacterium]|nr:CBS domain-containing protein [Candidatus Dormibacteraeota bacterium]